MDVGSILISTSYLRYVEQITFSLFQGPHPENGDINNTSVRGLCVHLQEPSLCTYYVPILGTWVTSLNKTMQESNEVI